MYQYGHDREKFVEACKRGGSHLVKLDKVQDGRFLALDDAGLCNIDCPYASTITARYYKGSSGNHDNMVMEVYLADSEETGKSDQ